MKNVEILSSVLIEWAKPMIDDVAGTLIGDRLNVADSWIKKYFPVSADYRLWNDLSFLALPVVNMAVAPMLNKGMEALGLSDEAIPVYAHSVVDAMLSEAEKKGSVTFLERYTFSLEDMRRLKELLNSNLSL